MILYFDEDIGKGVPSALFGVNLKTILWKSKRYGTATKIPDTRWLTDAGREKWLAFSCNTEILNVELERELIEQENLGIVFLTSGQENGADLLRLILNKWKWLESIDAQVERPFVFTIRIDGHTRRVPIAPIRKRRRRL